MDDHLFDWNVFRCHYDVPENLRKAVHYGMYAIHLFCKFSLDSAHDVPPFGDINLIVRSEIHQIVHGVRMALDCKIHLEWAIEDYLKSFDDGTTDVERSQRFPPNPGTHKSGLPFDEVHYPCTFVDKNGRIVWWYLPAIIRESRWEKICDTVFSLSRACPRAFSRPRHISSADFHASFKIGDQFAQGQAIMYPAGYFEGDMDYDIPFPSRSFRHADRYFGFEFLDMLETDTMAIIGTVLALTQPVLFHVSLEMFEKLHQGNVSVGQPWVFHEVLSRWASPFGAYTVFNNCDHPRHRFSFSHPSSSTLYLSIGDPQHSRFSHLFFTNDSSPTILVHPTPMLLTTNPLLQGLTRLRAQKLVNYISARLRHCATHLTDRAEDIDRVPGLFAACWHQFKLDFNHGLLVYALVSLQYPETISAPAFLKSLHRLLVEGGIDSCDAVKREANRHDPPYDDFGVPTSTAWWVDITGNSPPDTTPPNFPITHIIDAFNREPDDAWPPWHLPVIVPQGWDSTKARPLAQSFEDLEKRLLTAETELRSAMEAIDVFRVDCRRFPPLLGL
ncbi:hypothetical protein CC2G_005121 [Coprinopsis cinerea AmutBmut pab1-1]|nr:hypothetical protein CC2G_005121 [Coprinopsis cinerea AmutBmut pab1-1]